VYKNATMIYKRLLLFTIITIVIAFVYIVYVSNVAKTQYLAQPNELFISTEYQHINFDKDRNDVFSFMHMQKTGGTTMEKHLVFNIKNSNCECEKTKRPLCMCYRSDHTEIYIVCRYIQPKWPCGLHPDLTTLKECTPNFMNNMYEEKDRRYFYGTILRNPTYRFLSEFRHMQRGAVWQNAASLCRGKMFGSQTKSCFQGIWTDLTLDKFLSCPYNQAINRQTWMMSNISAVSCNFEEIMSRKKLKKKLLRIAKRNLNKLSYFALLEFPMESQFIFEKTFNFEFKEPFIKWDTGFALEYLRSFNVNTTMMHLVSQTNDLDHQLYDYAKIIFFKRYNYFLHLYGKPKYKRSNGKTRFDLNGVKLERIKYNLPKSEVKEMLLRKKREKEIEKLKQSKGNLNT